MKMQKSPNQFFFILSGSCLLSGVGIYALARVYAGHTFFTLVRNFGADGLWLLSLEFALAPFIQELFPRKYPTVLVTVCSFTGCLFEYLQEKGICKGTGDVLDCIMYLAAAMVGCLIIKKIYMRRETK